MDPSAAFYQTLTGVSFTLLGLWFTVLQLGHGGWRSDPHRHRLTSHIALHFFLPGALGLASLLGGPAGSGTIWRVTFVVGGLLGLIDSVTFLFSRSASLGAAAQALRLADPLLWVLVIVAAFLPSKVLTLTPLQIEGAIVGLVFVSGLCYVWLAFAERQPAAQPGYAAWPGGAPPRPPGPATWQGGQSGAPPRR